MKKALHIYAVYAVCLLAGFAAAPARAGILEFLFPSLRSTEHDPTPDGMAPFTAQQKQEAGPEEDHTPEAVIPLDKRHRSNADIGEWLMMVVSEAMSFGGSDYRGELAGTAGYFDESGRRLYTDFLDKQGILNVLQSGKYYVRGFVEGQPLLLNEGEVDGRYRWLYEIPVMVSYMDRTMTSYKKSKPVSRTMVLTVQLGRSAAAGNGHGILIERWSGKTAGKK